MVGRLARMRVSSVIWRVALSWGTFRSARTNTVLPLSSSGLRSATLFLALMLPAGVRHGIVLKPNRARPANPEAAPQRPATGRRVQAPGGLAGCQGLEASGTTRGGRRLPWGRCAQAWHGDQRAHLLECGGQGPAIVQSKLLPTHRGLQQSDAREGRPGEGVQSAGVRNVAD